MLHDLNIVIVERLLLAAALGGVVGLERELRHKPAGLRTMMLICIGAALYDHVVRNGGRCRRRPYAHRGSNHSRYRFHRRGRGDSRTRRRRGYYERCYNFHDCECRYGGWSRLPDDRGLHHAASSRLASFSGTHRRPNRSAHSCSLTFTMTTPPGDPSILERVHQIVQEAGVQAVRWKTHRSQTGAAIVEFDADVSTPKERELLNRLNALNVHCEARPVVP